MSTVISILVALIVLGIMIFVHELGHFIVGRKCGIPVLEFAIGFGPKLIKWERGGTKYSLRLLPIGGFCAFLGEDENNDNPKAMNNQPVWKRLLTILAGPVFNIVFALILATAFLTAYGDTGTAVTQFPPNAPSAAREAGIREGDMIVALNGKNVVFSSEVLMEIEKQKNVGTIGVTVEREGQTLDFTIQKIDGKMGVMLQTPKTFSFFEAIRYSFRWTYLIIRDLLGFIVGIFAGTQSTADVGGVVSIVSIIGEAVPYGFNPILRIAALISVNLGLFNLFPLPAVDGGRVVFLIIEGIRRKPVPREKEGLVHFIGLVALLCLMAVITYGDIARLIKG